MAELIVVAIIVGIPYLILVGVIQLFNLIRDWLRNRREKSLESHYLQHMQMSELEQTRSRQEAQRRQQLARQKQLHQKRQRLGRQLQLAFMQLADAPDAQRLLSWTNQCTELPLDFRRRQLSRFQRLLMEQIPRWLAAGVERERLEQDLRLVVRNMGVAKFEADYMVSAMNPNQPTTPNPSDADVFAGQLAEIQADHQRRLQTIEAMVNLEPDVKEELLEAEQQRYRAMLFGRKT